MNLYEDTAWKPLIVTEINLPEFEVWRKKTIIEGMNKELCR
jgi:hypothetical protein